MTLPAYELFDRGVYAIRIGPFWFAIARKARGVWTAFDFHASPDGWMSVRRYEFAAQSPGAAWRAYKEGVPPVEERVVMNPFDKLDARTIVDFVLAKLNQESKQQEDVS